MNPESPMLPARKTAFWIALGVLLLGAGAELAALLILNSGYFVFSLDDAYIHLAMAENIMNGHYGINMEEFCSPSSSILWPFLLAPFTLFQLGVSAVFLINLLSAAGTLFLLWKILTWVFETDASSAARTTGIVAFFLVLFIPATNLIGLIFTGMEHSLQVFFSVLAVWGLIHEIRSRKVSPWLILAIVAGPLIRYENLAMSLPALLYLFLRGHRKTSIFSAAVLAALVGAFSVFLVLLDLEPFPTSVLVKSPLVRTGGSTRMFLRNLNGTFQNSRGILLFLSMLVLAVLSFARGRKKEERLFAGSIVFAVLLHMLVGRYDRYSRYEIYILIATLLAILYLSRGKLTTWVRRRPLFFSGVCVAAAILVLCTPYPNVLLTTPFACNNVYEQHYQMHRFAVDYYRKPVAVNDLGYVSYRNPHFVLDLLGLGSFAALNHMLAGGGPKWMDELAAEHNVRLAMISDGWFRAIPSNWRKVGELRLGGKQITSAFDVVAFYAMDRETRDEVARLLADFQKTLPKGVTLDLLE